MVNRSKIHKLVDTLCERTESDLVKWERTVHDNVFQTVLSSHVIRILKQDNTFDMPTYIVSIFSPEGKEVETITDGQLDEEVGNDHNTEYYAKLESAFIKARRAARGVDKVIDDILRDLE